MEEICSSESDSLTDLQEMSRLLCNPNVYCQAHKSQPLLPILD